MTMQQLKNKPEDKPKRRKPDDGARGRYRDGGGPDDDDQPGDNPSPTKEIRLKKLWAKK